MSLRKAIRLATFALAALPALVVASAVSAQSGGAVVHNKRIVAAAFDAWRDQTGSFFDILAPDAEWTIVGTGSAAGTYRSREAFLAEVIDPFNARMSVPLKPTVRALYGDGDMVIALWDGEGVANDGQPYRNTYTWYLQFSGDKVVKAIAFFDMVEFNDFWQRVTPKP